MVAEEPRRVGNGILDEQYEHKSATRDNCACLPEYGSGLTVCTTWSVESKERTRSLVGSQRTPCSPSGGQLIICGVNQETSRLYLKPPCKTVPVPGWQ